MALEGEKPLEQSLSNLLLSKKDASKISVNGFDC